jgi:hypothetical protein
MKQYFTSTIKLPLKNPEALGLSSTNPLEVIIDFDSVYKEQLFGKDKTEEQSSTCSIQIIAVKPIRNLK